MNSTIARFENPYRPGAGHPPPFLAGRSEARREFRNLLNQNVILENIILTGLRGVGKTVLLDDLRPEARQAGWYWVGSEISESATISEANIATRLMTDLAIISSTIQYATITVQEMGFGAPEKELPQTMTFHMLQYVFDSTPGLIEDKLKSVLKFVWFNMKDSNKRGIIFAYDEAQNLSDQSAKDQFPLSILLDVFMSLQKQGVRFMLVLAGLPMLFQKLVDARTYAERMFHTIFLDRLDSSACREAVKRPLEVTHCPVGFDEPSIEEVCKISGGYPYFIQFICKEIFDIWVENEEAEVFFEDVIRKLDEDFFAGRWSRPTDRQRELLCVIASLDNANEEFTVQEIIKYSRLYLDRPFRGPHANQMLSALMDRGLVFKNRHGRYSFAVPLLDSFIRRQAEYEALVDRGASASRESA